MTEHGIGTLRAGPSRAARSRARQRARSEGVYGEFAAFVASSAERLVQTAYLMLDDLGRAEDVSQETLAKVASRWLRVRRMENPYGYARRILFNLALAEQARRHRRPESLGEIPDRVVPDAATAVADRDEVVTALAQLPPRQRATLVLRFWEDLSEADTAALLGCSLGTVKSQTAKGLQRLRPLLGTPHHALVPTPAHVPPKGPPPC